MGDKITRADAENLMIAQLKREFIPSLQRIPTWKQMNLNQQGAIMSFAYNLGAAFYGGENFETITRALKTTAGWKDVPRALTLYVNPGSSVEAGLRRRRAAEGKLWGTAGGSAATPAKATAPASAKSSPGADASAPAPSSGGGVLNVPYFSQRDNYRDASRTCFSSTNAMLLKFLKPGAIKGDDDYVRTVFSIGDTTIHGVQIAALAKYGVSARSSTGCSFSTLDSQLAKGKPVPIGINHKGPPGRTYGGHWLIVIGKSGKNYVVNDPWGKIDNASGTYPSTNGNRQVYTYETLKARWTVEGPSSGWCILV